MRLNRKWGAYVIAVSISIVLSGCASSTLTDQRRSAEATASNAQPPTCGDLLDYYSELAAQTADETDTADATTWSTGRTLDICPKLHQAIFLSVPGNRQQNDKRAIEILQELKRSDMLYGRDLEFSTMLLQHVTQRQDLRKQIAAQKEQLAKLETHNNSLRKRLTRLQTQLDQLKHIEVEIEKKERSLTSPIEE